MDRDFARPARGLVGDAAGRSRGPKAYATLLAASALGAFALALHGPLLQETAAATTPCALALHGALPLADALLGTLLGLVSFALCRSSPRALLFALLAAGMLWCRAAQDALFHLTHASAAGPVGSGLCLEAGVDLVGFVLGAATIACVWRWRVVFAAGEHARSATPTRPPSLTALGVILLLAGVGITAAWAGWFTAGRAALASQRCVVVFADSLPLAEEGVALAAVLGGIGILRRRPWGLLWSLTTSGGLAYVALVEALFFAQHRIPDTPQAELGSALVLLLSVTSAVSAGVAWRCRSWLLGDPGRGYG